MAPSASSSASPRPQQRGADLAVLPELPLNPWRPASKDAHDDDAEPMDGRRATAQADAAREAGIGLVGGIIHRADDGRRTSRALIFDAAGNLKATYDKLHLPEEPGFWETSHYEPGTEAPRRIDAFGVPIGVQICSDNQPAGGDAPARSPGRDGVDGSAGQRGEDLPALEADLPLERADGLPLRPQRQPAAPGRGRADRRPERRLRSRTASCCSRRPTRSALVTLDAATVTDARRAYPGLPAGPRPPLRRRLVGDRDDRRLRGQPSE